MMRKVTHPEVDEMRTTEGHRLDELADQNRQLVELALGAEALEAARQSGDPGDLLTALATINLETAQRGLREIHGIVRTRAMLFGLDTGGGGDEPSGEHLNALIQAYLTGVADVHENR